MSEAMLERGSVKDAPRADTALREALAEGNIPTLLAVLVQLTGDDRWLRDPYQPRRGKALSDNDDGGLGAAVQQEVRDAVYDAVLRHRRGEITPATLTYDQIATILGITMVEDVPAEYGPLLAEEMGLRSRDVEIAPELAALDFSVVVIGAGMSGICAARKLKAAGLDFTVLEKDGAVGGTWHENTYPGCGVDTPSHLYSFAFARSASWPRYFSKQAQVNEYMQEVAATGGILDNIQFDTEVVDARWDCAALRWQVTSRSGDVESTITCNVLISAVGMVNRPSIPPIPGLERFQGPSMHTAAWRSDVAIADQRVAVIGTGASAMQLVPSIADDAARVLVFQRSKQWILPHPNYHRDVSVATRHLLEHVPFYGGWYRLRSFWNFSDRLHPSLQIDPDWEHPERSINAVNEKHRLFLTRYVQDQLGDRQDLLADCLPDYPPYGKRPLIDNGWFRAVCRDDVDLITDPIAEVRAHSILTQSGQEYPVDVLVLATGFKTLQFLWPMDIRGASGRLLSEVWGPEDARAYLGITVPDFPNLFILNGPNTNAGHGGSAILATELQMHYIMDALRLMLANDVAILEVREDVFTEFNERLDEALSRTIWVHPGMTTYYRNSAGRVVVSSPWKYIDYWRWTQAVDPGDYICRQK